MSDVLMVYLQEQPVGRLWLDADRRFIFQYDERWLANPNAVPLSIALPLQADVYADDEARPFFANLLPESELRRVIARRLGLSEGNDFALLEAIGGECAGAVSLLPEETEPSEAGEYQTLDDDELNVLIKELPRRPLLAGERGIRLSLAGVQNKLPVLYDEEAMTLYLPRDGAPSVHILKPPIAHFAHTVENETFCMQLAQRMGLPVPRVWLLTKALPLYLVARYDREMMPGRKVSRRHQEDFCQALGVAPDMKYEKEGGPALEACFELVRQVSLRPIADIKAMLNWVVFNYLIGNADAHGKNISLLFMEGGPVLAPFYDLMSTVVYPELAVRLAMKIGGEDRPDWVIGRRWEQFARDVGVKFTLVHQTLTGMSDQIRIEGHELREAFASQHGECEIIDRIMEVIEQRAQKITRALAPE